MIKTIKKIITGSDPLDILGSVTLIYNEKLPFIQIEINRRYNKVKISGLDNIQKLYSIIESNSEGYVKASDNSVIEIIKSDYTGFIRRSDCNKIIIKFAPNEYEWMIHNVSYIINIIKKDITNTHHN